MGFLAPLGEIQRQEIEAKRAPAELEHMQALTRVNQANAGALEAAEHLRVTGQRAMEGFQPTGTASKDLLEMAMRQARVGNFVQADKLSAVSVLALQRETQAEVARVKEAEQKAALGKRQLDAIMQPYLGLTSTTPEGLAAARKLAVMRGQAAGMKPEEIAEAIKVPEQAIATGGPLAVEQMLRSATSAHDLINVKINEMKVGVQKKLADDLIRHRRTTESQTAARDAAREQRVASDTKAGSARVGAVTKDLRDSARFEISRDPDFEDLPFADRGAYAERIASGAMEKVEANKLERNKNLNIPPLSRSDAILETLGEVKRDLPKKRSFLDRFKSEPEKAPKPDITQAEYKALPVGGEYWYKGKSYKKVKE